MVGTYLAPNRPAWLDRFALDSFVPVPLLRGVKRQSMRQKTKTRGPFAPFESLVKVGVASNLPPPAIVGTRFISLARMNYTASGSLAVGKHPAVVSILAIAQP